MIKILLMERNTSLYRNLARYAVADQEGTRRVHLNPFPASRVADLVFSEKTVTDYDDAGAEPRFLERGVHMFKRVGFALLILSHFSEISHGNDNLVSLRPNYFIFIGYL